METRLKPADYIFVSRMKYDAGTKVLINAGLEIILVRQNEDGSFEVWTESSVDCDEDCPYDEDDYAGNDEEENMDGENGFYSPEPGSYCTSIH